MRQKNETSGGRKCHFAKQQKANPELSTKPNRCPSAQNAFRRSTEQEIVALMFMAVTGLTLAARTAQSSIVAALQQIDNSEELSGFAKDR